jgi:hypothetical protein
VHSQDIFPKRIFSKVLFELLPAICSWLRWY